MKRSLAIIMLFVSLLLGIAATNAAAQDVVILVCDEDEFAIGAVKPMEVRRCSKSAGVTRACPTADGASCAVNLAAFLSGGLSIANVQPYGVTGMIYTLVR